MPLMLNIVNVGGRDGDHSDYRWTLYLVPNGDIARIEAITQGNIYGHKRSDGWKALIKRMLEQS